MPSNVTAAEAQVKKYLNLLSSQHWSLFLFTLASFYNVSQ